MGVDPTSLSDRVLLEGMSCSLYARFCHRLTQSQRLIGCLLAFPHRHPRHREEVERTLNLVLQSVKLMNLVATSIDVHPVMASLVIKPPPPRPSLQFVGLELPFVIEVLFKVGLVVVKYLLEDVNLVIETLEVVPEWTVKRFLICFVDGLPHVLRQVPVRASLPVILVLVVQR